MSDFDLQRTLHLIEATGLEVDLIVELIESGRYTVEDQQRIHDALIASWDKHAAQHSAWIRTPTADSFSRVTHAWVETAQRSVFESACHLVMTATAFDLVAAHHSMDGLAGLRHCKPCEKGFARQEGTPIKFGELYERTPTMAVFNYKFNLPRGQVVNA